MIFNESGGMSLNFKVLGGTSTPASPKENTIWVNTSTAITDWVFKATQPTAATGRVWILTGNSSVVMFNASKKNWLYVYPISVKQYVNGAWVDKTAKTYQNGAWVDWWNGDFFKDGNQFEAITGGWTGLNQGIVGSNSLSTNFFVGCSTFVTNNKVDITNYSKLCATFKTNEKNDSRKQIKCGISDNAEQDNYSSVNTFTNFTAGNTVTVELDVSSVSGKYYIKLGSYCCGSDITWVRGE